MEVDDVGGGYPADLLELASDVAMVPGVPRCETVVVVVVFFFFFLFFSSTVEIHQPHRRCRRTLPIQSTRASLVHSPSHSRSRQPLPLHLNPPSPSYPIQKQRRGV